jgi:type I restriction enzyme M protein
LEIAEDLGAALELFQGITDNLEGKTEVEVSTNANLIGG